MKTLKLTDPKHLTALEAEAMTPERLFKLFYPSVGRSLSLHTLQEGLELILPDELSGSKITIKVSQDEDCNPPVNQDSLFTFACYLDKYRLGNESPSKFLDDLINSICDIFNLAGIDYDSETIACPCEGVEGCPCEGEGECENIDYFNHAEIGILGEDYSTTVSEILVAASKIAARHGLDPDLLSQAFPVMQPLYRSDSGPSVITTTRRGRAWTCPLIGHAYLTWKKASEEYGITPNSRCKVIDSKPPVCHAVGWPDVPPELPANTTFAILEDVLDDAIDEYDSYLRGDCYGFKVITCNPAVEGHEGYEEARKGFIGGKDRMLREIEDTIKNAIVHELRSHEGL